MHASLRTKNNLVGLVVSGMIAAAVWIFSSPRPVAPILIGGFFGLVVGLLQDRSSRVVPEAFRRAAIGADVRDALKSNRAGRAAIKVHWIATLVTIVAAIWVGKPLVGTIGGWALYACTRHLVVLPAVITLNRKEDAAGLPAPESKSNTTPPPTV